MNGISRNDVLKRGEILIRTTTFIRLLGITLVLASIVAALAALNIPVGLWALILPAALFLLWAIQKFVRDNKRLARKLGFKRLILGILRTFLVFIPVLILLIPGFMLGHFVNKNVNLWILQLQAWSAPERISKEIKREIRETVEKEVKKNVPWYYKPLVWTGQIRDYEKIVANETRILVEKVTKSKRKPWHVRALAEFGKTALLVISIYMTTWMLLLFLRAFAGLFGRIVVAMDPPVQFDLHPWRYRSKQKISPDFAETLAVGLDLPLRLESGETLYVRRSIEPANIIPSASLRIKSGAFFQRLRRGLLFMTRIRGGEVTGEVHFHGSGGNQYVLANLGEDQFVVINPSHLVAFSGSIRFSSHYDFSLAMLSMQRGVSMVARGPGRLVVTVPGSPIIHDNASCAKIVHMDKLILFGMDARFSICWPDFRIPVE